MHSIMNGLYSICNMHSFQLPCCPAPAPTGAAASLAARRATPSARHMRRCPPSRQSACEQAVPQYHTARQALGMAKGKEASK